MSTCWSACATAYHRFFTCPKLSARITPSLAPRCPGRLDALPCLRWQSVAAIIGLLVGHAVELTLDRSYSDSPLGGALTHCPTCRSPVRTVDLLPVIGYLLRLGRCPDCHQRLPLRALLLAPATALCFALAALATDDWGATILTGVFSAIFLALLFTDLERRLLPNRIVYPAMLLAMALSWAWPTGTPPRPSPAADWPSQSCCSCSSSQWVGSASAT